MKGSNPDFERLTLAIRDFSSRRNWERFHNPKNLAMAVGGEAGELIAEFQWLTHEESLRESLTQEKLDAVAMEIADVQIYLLRLADILGIDIPSAVESKMALNEGRF